MLVILLFLFSTNCFISTAANDNEEAVAVSSTSLIEPIEEETGAPISETSPIEPNTDSVPSDKCSNNGTLTCGENEILDDCPSKCPSDFCPTCEGQNQKCPRPKPCPPPACKCRFNYRRARNGKCIPTRDCPAFRCNKPNEVYTACPPLCPTDDCKQATPDGRCPLPGRIGIILECNPKCRCKKNYWRKNGICVPYDQCPGKLKCRRGDIVDNCPQICNTDYCPKNDKDIRICSTPIICQKPECKCPFNHLRAANGTCIPASSCPPIKCTKPNEEYNSCPPACPSDDCKDATLSGKCPKPGHIGVAVECQPGCRCKKSYWRQNGTCVPFGQCGLDCSGPHEYYACGGACDNVCKDLHIQSQDNCPIINIRCNDMCYCEKGYARDDKGICIPISRCPKKPIGLDCSGPHEYYACGGACDNVCKDLHIQSQDNCPIRNIKCNDMCYCEKGYARDDKGICIPISRCPKRPIDKRCPFPNEKYTTCKKGCPSDRCSSVVEDCVANSTCGPGCACLPGYLRKDDNQPCVPVCQCPEFKEFPQCKRPDKRCRFPNEEYTDCKKGCPSDRCSSVVENCIPDKSCSPGCVCSSGYLRKADNQPCVPVCQCPEFRNFPQCKRQTDPMRCSGENEHLSCVKECPPPRTCRNRHVMFSCTLESQQSCTVTCVCKNNFYRNSERECVRAEYCDD